LARFAGTVLDAARKPLPAAIVVARSADGAIATTRANERGEFAVEVLPPGPYALLVDGEGHAPWTRQRQAPGSGIVVQLERGGTLEGRVIDGGTRQPAAGVRVVAAEAARGSGSSWEPGFGHRSAVTNDAGRFRITGVGRGFVDLTASGASALGARLRNQRAGASPALLVLLPMGQVSGQVLDPEGKPARGAVVRLEPGAPSFRGGGTAVAADDDGRFAIEALEPGTWRVLARGPGAAPDWAMVEVERGAIADVPLRLEAPVAVGGRLVDEGRQPASEGRLEWLEKDGEPVPRSLTTMLTVRSSGDGRFAVSGLPPGRHRLEARAPGFAPETFEATAVRGDADAGDVRLSRGLTVRGVVRGPDGRPVPDAVVRVELGPQPVPVESPETRSGSDGRFTLPGLRPGAVRLVASAEGLGRGTASAETGVDDVVLVLKPYGGIRGVVVDEAQRPVTAFRVTARAPDFRGFHTDEASDAEGRFELRDVEPGTYAVEARAPGRVRAALPAVVVSEGVPTDVGTLVLRGGGTIRGQVVDKSGAPVAGAELTGRQGRNQISFGDDTTAVSDAAGQFELNGFAAGPVQLAATHPLYAPAQATVEVDPAGEPAEATLTLSTGGRIEGRLARRDGTPITTGRINVMPLNAIGPGGLLLLAPDADGRFVAERVPPGRVRVTWLKGSGGSFQSAQMREAEVVDGQTTTLDLTLAEIRVSGKVTRGGQPVPGVRVQFAGGQSMRMMFSGGGRGARPDAEQPGVTREDGTYEITVDEPGPGRISVASLDGRTSYPNREVTVPDVEAWTLDIALPAALVRGSVVDAGGQPVEAIVTAGKVEGDGGVSSTAQAGADGRFELTVEPGTWRLRARAMGFSGDPADVEVSEAGLEDVRLTLTRARTLRGRVVDAAGRGIAGASVSARAPGLMQPWTESEADGRFQIPSVPDAPITVAAATTLGAFAFRPSARVADDELVLSLRAGARLRARVVDESGAPVPGAWVAPRVVAGEAFQVAQAPLTTDGDGRVELWIPAGFGRVEVHASVSGRPGSGTVALDPAEGQELEAEITWKAPAPGTPPGV
jgi:hypothetical protein